MEGPMKNIPKGEPVDLRDLVPYQEGQVVSRTLAQNEHVSVTLFAFEKGEEISTHASGGDAMVTVLEGTGRFTVGGRHGDGAGGHRPLHRGRDGPHADPGPEPGDARPGSPCGVRPGAVQDAADRGVLRRFWADGR